MGDRGCPPTGSLQAMGCRGDDSMLREGARHSWDCASQWASGHPLCRAREECGPTTLRLWVWVP